MKELWQFVMNWINSEPEIINFTNDIEHWSGFMVTSQAYHIIILIGSIIGALLILVGIITTIFNKEIFWFDGENWDLMMIPVVGISWIGLWIGAFLIQWILFAIMYIWPLWIFIGILFGIKWARDYERPIKQPKPIDETERYQQELLSNFK